MPNVLITTYCNKKCKYCFAKDKVDIGIETKSNISKEISLENLNTIIRFFKKSNYYKFPLIGGEPTLHSKFREIINLLYSHGFKIHIFSNATWKDEYNKLFKNIEPNRLSFLLNINSPDETPKEEQDKIESNLKALSNRPSVALGINIYKPGFEYKYIIKLALKYGIKRIRWCLTNPIIGKKGNEYVKLEDAHLYADRIVDFSDECARHNISTSSDCSIPLCIFSEQQVGKLILNGTHGLTRNNCIGGPVDIGPDLNLWKCFSFSQLNNLYITDFDNLGQIHTYYSRVLEKYSTELFSMEECHDCKLRQRGLCIGGCPGYSVIKNGLKLDEGVII